MVQPVMGKQDEKERHKARRQRRRRRQRRIHSNAKVHHVVSETLAAAAAGQENTRRKHQGGGRYQDSGGRAMLAIGCRQEGDERGEVGLRDGSCTQAGYGGPRRMTKQMVGNIETTHHFRTEATGGDISVVNSESVDTSNTVAMFVSHSSALPQTETIVPQTPHKLSSSLSTSPSPPYSSAPSTFPEQRDRHSSETTEE